MKNEELRIISFIIKKEKKSIKVSKTVHGL
jgi:hypothetical protein